MAGNNKDKAENESTDAEQEVTSNSNSKMKLIVILALCMVILSITAMVSTIFLTMNRDTAQVASIEGKNKDPAVESDDSEEADEKESEEVNSGPPLFYQFNPTFVVNIPSKGRAKFLQVQVQVMSYDQDVIDRVEQYAPVIKNDLVQLFGQQEYSELIKPNSKETLRNKSLKLIKNLLTKHTGEDGVEQVLFTSFITQ